MPIKGFTCGSFDLTHAGHYLMFEECRSQCDWLIVGLQTNPHLDRPEKHVPIQSLKERIFQVGACKWVDKIVVYDTEQDLIEVLRTERPDIRFLGADWKEKHFTGDDLNIKIIFNSRDHNYSSSNLIKRIKNA